MSKRWKFEREARRKAREAGTITMGGPTVRERLMSGTLGETSKGPRCSICGLPMAHPMHEHFLDHQVSKKERTGR